jgi:hypothetical protein
MQMELHQFVCNQGGRISLTLQPRREITNNEQSARVITIPSSSSQMSFARNQPDAYLCVRVSDMRTSRALQPDPLRRYAPLIRGRSAIRLFVFQLTNVYVVYSQLEPAGRRWINSCLLSIRTLIRSDLFHLSASSRRHAAAQSVDRTCAKTDKTLRRWPVKKINSRGVRKRDYFSLALTFAVALSEPRLATA